VETLLVASSAEATRGLPVNTNTIEQIFGKFPEGKENPVAKGGGGSVAPKPEPTRKQGKAPKEEPEVKIKPPPTSGAPEPSAAPEAPGK
jgi:hypothetical protein